MEERAAHVDGIPMRWLDGGGERMPVVFLHGIPTSPRLWRHVVPQLEGVRALAWEMVGYGSSSPAPAARDISVAAQASYLRAWLKNQELEDVVLVGHDLGGGVAQIAAVAEPRRFSGIVLINSIAYDSWPVPSVKVMRALGGLVATTPPWAFRAVFGSFLHRGHDDRRIARESIAAHWPSYDHPGGSRAFVGQLRSLDVNDTLRIAPDLPSLRLPASVVWGAADQFQKLEYGEKLARDLGAEIDAIEGAKHFVPEDHPDRVASAVLNVVKEAAA